MAPACVVWLAGAVVAAFVCLARRDRAEHAERHDAGADCSPAPIAAVMAAPTDLLDEACVGSFSRGPGRGKAGHAGLCGRPGQRGQRNDGACRGGKYN